MMMEEPTLIKCNSYMFMCVLTKAIDNMTVLYRDLTEICRIFGLNEKHLRLRDGKHTVAHIAALRRILLVIGGKFLRHENAEDDGRSSRFNGLDGDEAKLEEAKKKSLII